MPGQPPCRPGAARAGTAVPSTPQARTPCRPESRSRCPRRLAPSPAPRPAAAHQVRCPVGSRGWDPGGGGRPRPGSPCGCDPQRSPGPGPGLAADLRHPQLAGGGHPEERRARHSLAAETRPGLGPKGTAGGPALGRGESRAGRGAVGCAMRSPEPAPVGFSCAAGRRRYSGERAVFGPKTRDLGNRCKRGNVQRKLSGEVSFLQASEMWEQVCMTYVQVPQCLGTDAYVGENHRYSF